MNGYVSNIQRFSTQDGPGLRTTVFLKGCPLRCPWCHNRETWLPAPSLLYYAKECVLCGACAAACTKGVHEFIGSQHLMRREKCAACGNCARECPTGALELRGETCTPEELLDLVCRDRPFYEQSGGGVTFSGGEPLMQFDFVKQCLHLLRDGGVHICLDTSGWGGHAAELAPLVDLFLWDIKHTDAEKHRALTGVELLRQLQETAVGRIDIMAGCGVKRWNIQEIHDRAGITVFHTTGRKGALDSGMRYRKQTVAMGLPSLSEYEIWQTDEDEFRACAEIVHSFAGAGA